MMKRLYFIWLSSLAILPILQGGYFYFEVFAFGLIQGIILIGLRSDKKIIIRFDGFRIFYILIIVSAFLSTLRAVDIGMHLLGLLKIAVPYLFILNYDSFKTHFDAHKLDIDKEIVTASILSGAIQTLFIIVAMAILPSEHVLVQYFVQENRIGGFFQYANTYGIYLFILFVFTQRYIAHPVFKSVLTFLFICGLYLSQSRGVILLAIIYTVILFVYKMKGNRRNGMIFMLVVIMSCIAGQILLASTTLAFDLSRNRSFDARASEWLTRLLYYKDGLKMLVVNPLGYGHMGYYYAQRSYQTGSAYLVKYIHSSILQMGIDYGVLAMLSIAAFGFYEILNSALKLGSNLKWRFNSLKKSTANKRFIKDSNSDLIPRWIFRLGMVLAFVHTWIDFDMEFISIVLMLIIAFISVEKARPLHRKSSDRSILEDAESDGIRSLHLFIHRASMFMFVGIMACYCYFGIVTFLEYSEHSDIAYSMYPLYTQAADDILNEPKKYPDISLNEKVDMARNGTMRNAYFINGVAFLAEYDYNNSKIEASLKSYKYLIDLAPLWLNYLEKYAQVALIECENLNFQKKLFKNNIYLEDIRSLSNYMDELRAYRETKLVIKNKLVFVMSKELSSIEEKGRKLYMSAQD